jgi:hypothetical protein
MKGNEAREWYENIRTKPRYRIVRMSKLNFMVALIGAAISAYHYRKLLDDPSDSFGKHFICQNDGTYVYLRPLGRSSV